MKKGAVCRFLFTRKHMKDKKQIRSGHAVTKAMLAKDGGLGEFYEVAYCGEFWDWRYGNFSVTAALLERIVTNFNAGLPGGKLALDINHDPSHKAVAWVAELKVSDDGQSLLCRFEDWTEDGKKHLTEGEYRYFSVEFGPFERPDGMGGVETIPGVLFGIAMTNRPVLKGMDGTFCDAEKLIEEFPEAKAEMEKAKSALKGNDLSPAMKDALKKFSAQLLGRKAGVTKEDVEGYQVMLSALPEADRGEFAETTKQIEQKCADTMTAAMKLADEEKNKDSKIKQLEEDQKVLLADKAKREEGEAVAALMLSEKTKKGFPEGNRAKAEELVKAIGVGHAIIVAAALADVTVLDPAAVEQKGKTGEGAKNDDLSVKLADANKAAAERSAKDGTPLHEALMQEIKARGIDAMDVSK